MKPLTANIINKYEIMPDTYILEIYAPQVSANARPGQFIMVDCGHECILRRPISIYNAEENGEISLLFKVVGKGTRNLSQYEVGGSIDLIGPLGNGFFINERSKKILLVAGGIGIAPISFLAFYAQKRGINITLLEGAANGTQIINKSLLPEDTITHVTTENGSLGKKGMVTDLLPEFIDKYDQIFACGPLEMYKTINNMLKFHKINKDIQISLELRMGCGLGICFGCSIKTKNGMKQVCKDGPIFNLQEIYWEWVKI